MEFYLHFAMRLRGVVLTRRDILRALLLSSFEIQKEKNFLQKQVKFGLSNRGENTVWGCLEEYLDSREMR